MASCLRIAFIAAMLFILGAASVTYGQQPAKPDSSGYIAANGVSYWFEIHGKGDPLLLLHGGLMSTGAFGPVLTELAKHRRGGIL